MKRIFCSANYYTFPFLIFFSIDNSIADVDIQKATPRTCATICIMHVMSSKTTKPWSFSLICEYFVLVYSTYLLPKQRTVFHYIMSEIKKQSNIKKGKRNIRRWLISFQLEMPARSLLCMPSHVCEGSCKKGMPCRAIVSLGMLLIPNRTERYESRLFTWF